MADTNIEWADAVWNPTTGCTRVSAGCDHCYAVPMTRRLEGMGKSKYVGLTVRNKEGALNFNGVVKTHEDALQIPLTWQRGAKRFLNDHGHPRRVFVNSMSDLFHKEVPFEFIDKVLAVMALCPDVIFMVLTKRAGRMAEYFNAPREPGGHYSTYAHVLGWVNVRRDRLGLDDAGLAWPLQNLWLGVSVEDQKAADERIPELLKCPAAVRFLSIEPQIGAVDLIRSIALARHKELSVMLSRDSSWNIHWVIVGGESGGGARQFDVAWARSIVQQCKAAGVACFVKQLGANVFDQDTTGATHFEPDECWPDGTKTDYHRVLLKSSKGGEISEWPEDLRVRQFPDTKSSPAPAVSKPAGGGA